MDIVEKINEDLKQLPLILQSEALNFVEYLVFKHESLSSSKKSVIESTPDICFGKPRIRNTRIPVWLLVSFRNQGASNQELLRNYPSLTLTDLEAAWDYYRNHKDEIDQDSYLANNNTPLISIYGFLFAFLNNLNLLLRQTIQPINQLINIPINC